MKCPKCDKEIPDGAKFCTKCGANIEEARIEAEKLKIEEERKLKEAEETKKKAEEEQKAKEAEEAKKKAEEEQKAKEAEEAKKKAKEEQKAKEAKKKAEEEQKTKEESKKKAEKEEKSKDSKTKDVKSKDDTKKKKSKAESSNEKKEINKEENSEEKPKEEKTTEPIKEKEAKPKKKKKHILLKLIIVLIFIAIILFAGSYGLYRIDLLPDSVKDVFLPAYELVDEWLGFENKEEQDEKEDENKTNSVKNETIQEEDEIKLLDEDKDLVYDYYNKKIAGNEYRIPAINLDYSNIESINKEIANLVEKELKEIENVRELPEGAISRTDYRWYQNKNILSVVFFIEGYHVDDYYVYNIDVYTGEEITNKDLLAAEKIDEDEFPEMCSEAVEDYYETYLYSKDIAESAGTVYDDAKRKSIDEDNFKVSKTDMFIGEDGKVYIIAKVTTIAGAGYNNFVINIENLKKNNKNIFSNTTTNSASNSVSNTVTNTTNTTNKTNSTNSI